MAALTFASLFAYMAGPILETVQTEAAAMGKFADCVYTDQADIALLESRATQLPDEAKVELVLIDGSKLEGVVSTRPVVQVFLDGEGEEGVNAQVRIDDARDPELSHYLWLDEILEVHQHGSD